MAQAQTLAAQGLPIGLICQQLGVHHATAWRWIQAADEDGDEEISLKAQFRKAINDSAVQLAKTHLSNLQHQSNEGNTQAATWLLTHHPALREHFSDAAADRRTERKTMATVLEAVAAVDLPAELEHALLLQMQARGLGTQQQEGLGG